MTLPLATLDGRIVLKGPLGAGGMGEVHRAWDATLERAVAVKFVKGGDPREADRLLLEARLQARVEHPHVVRVFDTGTLAGRPCIVMQLVEGRTYADRAGAGDWRTQVALGVQAARGLAAAHRMGLVHRDVKPANVLVEDSEEGPQARLSDFGLARDEEGSLTRSGLLVGTVDFMAPEQITGVVPVDFRADIYGLGATLYAVLAGRPPFRTAEEATAEAQTTRDLRLPTPPPELSAGALLRRVMEEEPRPLRQVVPGLPVDLGVVVAKAMEKDPGQRYASAEAFADDLERALRGEPVRAKPLGWGGRALRWGRRNPALARALGGALALAFAGGGLAGWSLLREKEGGRVAAELSAEATSMRELMRAARLMPFHPLAHEQQRVQQGMARVRQRMAAQGRLAQGPGNFALGLAEAACGRLEAAEPILRRAWEGGFRSEALHAELASVLLQRYQAELKRAELIESPPVRERVLSDLDRRFKQPARQLMAQLAPGNGEQGLLRARAALADQHHEEALRLADAALGEDGTRFEALHLKGLVLLDQGDRRMKAGQPREAVPYLERAGDCFAQAFTFARSSPELWRDEGIRRMTLAQAGSWTGRVRVEAFDAPEEALAKSLELDESNALAWRTLGRLRILRANAFYELGKPAQGPLEAALQALRRSEALQPDAGGTQALLAGAFELQGVIHRVEGREGTPAMLEALRHLRRAVALEPENEAHREGLVNTLGTTLDFLMDRPEQARPLAVEMLEGARWMVKNYPDRSMSRNALVVAAANCIQLGEGDPAARKALYEEARAAFEPLRATASGNLRSHSDLALSAGTVADTALAKGDPVEPWAGWSLDHARRLLADRPEDAMGLYSLLRAWRIQAESGALKGEVWPRALQETREAAALALARRLNPREVTQERARLLLLATEGFPAPGRREEALAWVRKGLRTFPGDPVLTACLAKLEPGRS